MLLYAAKFGFGFFLRSIELINFSSQSVSLHPSFFFISLVINTQKMKNILNIIFSGILILSSLNSCKKGVPSTPEPTPDPYTYNAELQSAKDISFATFAISDLDMMCSFVGENAFLNHFYKEVPGTSAMAANRDDYQKTLAIGFGKTSCIDGYLRDGSVFLSYSYDPNYNSAANPQSNYYRDYGFAGRLALGQYILNDWKIELFDASKHPHIVNRVSSVGYDPSKVDLTWEITGKFKFTHLKESSRDMIWEGTIVKTLTNTSDPAVFASNKSTAINWNLAKVSYTGIVSGIVLGDKPFSYYIDDNNALQRDFSCAVVPVGSTGVTQFHPFISGGATATISDYHPRIINYGSANACDNDGTISFNSETHTVKFD